MRSGSRIFIAVSGIGVLTALGAFLTTLHVASDLGRGGEFHSSAFNHIPAIDNGVQGAVQESFSYVVLAKIWRGNNFETGPVPSPVKWTNSPKWWG